MSQRAQDFSRGQDIGTKDMRADNKPTINVLPTELVLIIASLVDIPSAAALSLTCWSLYDKSDPTHTYSRLSRVDEPYLHRHLAEKDRLDFLARLERDHPGLELCHCCRKLKRSRRAAYGTLAEDPVRLWAVACTEYPKVHSSGFKYGRWALRLDFHDARMILRRHLHGEAHGFSPSALDRSTDWEVSGMYDSIYMMDGYFVRSDWLSKTDITSYIRNDQLLRHLCQRMWFPPDQRTSLKLYGMGAHMFVTCCHRQWGMTNVARLLAKRLSELFENPPASKAPVTSSSAIWRCESCPTEHAVTVYDHGSHGVEIVVDLWQNFGRCRTLDDVGWASHGYPFDSMIDVPRDHRYHERRWKETQLAGSDVGYFRDAIPDMARSDTAMGHPSASLIRGRLAACGAVGKRPHGFMRVLRGMVCR